MSRFAKWMVSTATLLAIGLMVQDASAQVGKKPKIVPTVDPPKRIFPLPADPRKPEPPRTNTLPVDPAKAAKADVSFQDFSFTTFRVVSIDEVMGTFVLESQGKREKRAWGPGFCILRGNTMSFLLEDLRVGDTVASISDQAAAGNLTSYLAVQEGSSKGSTLRAVTIRDVKAEARHIQVSSYQVGGGGERIMTFPYVGAQVFINKTKAPWEEIQAGDRGVMFFSGNNTWTHAVLNRAGPDSEGTTTRRTRLEPIPFSFGISKGTIKSINRTTGTFLFAPHGEHKGPKGPANLLCTVGNHLIVNRNRVETWGGLREGDQASFFFDARGLAAYALIHEGPNTNSTLACGTVESVDDNMKTVNINLFNESRPQESISLNFEEIRTRKQNEGEMVDAGIADFGKSTQVLVIRDYNVKLTDLLISSARFPAPTAGEVKKNDKDAAPPVAAAPLMPDVFLPGKVKFTDATMKTFVLQGEKATQRRFTLHENTFIVDGKRAGRFPDQAGPTEGDDAIIGILVGMLLPAVQVIVVNPEANSRLRVGNVTACDPEEMRISFSFSKIDYSARTTQLFLNGERTTALSDIPVGSRACGVVSVNGLGGNDTLTHLFVFTERPGSSSSANPDAANSAAGADKAGLQGDSTSEAILKATASE